MTDTQYRWAVLVQHKYRTKKLLPFLAGRYYFDRYDDGARHERDDMPKVATFDTREAARKRCRWVRRRSAHWCTYAKPVVVRITTEETA